MSTRYVWSQNEINHVQTAQLGSTWTGDTGYTSYVLSATINVSEYDNIWNSGTNIYSEGGSYPPPISCSAGKYYSISFLNGYIYCESSGQISVTKNRNHDSVDYRVSSGTFKAATRYEYDEKGSSIGTVSNASSSTYPQRDSRRLNTIICTILLILRRCSHVK